MGINALSWRRIRALNKRLGEKFVHVYTVSHYQHWLWWAIRHDGSAACVDTRSWTSIPAVLSADESSAVHLLTTREPRTEAHADFLRLADERYAEVLVDDMVRRLDHAGCVLYPWQVRVLRSVSFKYLDGKIRKGER